MGAPHLNDPQCLNLNDFDSNHGTEETIKTFPTMWKLVGGTLVGSVKYTDQVYIDSDEENTHPQQILTKIMAPKKSNIKYHHYRK